MQTAPRRPADSWAPLYFLSALGAGGISVTFFMWPYHWVLHPGQPVPVFEDIARAFAAGDILMQATILGAVAAIVIFAALHVKALVWNQTQYARFKQTEAHAKLVRSNAETQLTAMPLALAMAINVGFILGLVLVPGLWSFVEYLFPVALAAFVAVGWIAFARIGRFLARVLGEGGFNCAANNSFGQVLPAFALGMVGVGLSAPAALSTNLVTSGVALILSGFFLVAAE